MQPGPTFDNATAVAFCFESCRLVVSEESEFDEALACFTGLASALQCSICLREVMGL